MTQFTPDSSNFVAVMNNKKPSRLPFYEHLINPGSIENIIGRKFAGLVDGNRREQTEYFHTYNQFFLNQTYDVVSYEVCITEFIPDSGALSGGRPGPIQSRSDFERYPWREIEQSFWHSAESRFDSLVSTMPAGMMAVGGVGNGVFEISEDLVGLEYLPLMQVDDPDLYRDLYRKIGDTMMAIWSRFLPKYDRHFAACRIGDDLGFATSLLTNPTTVREHIVPQYKRLIDLVHSHGQKFLWHSCGCIFEVMEDFIGLGIDAKHSNEDGIAPFERWIESYGDRIGLLGGFDMDFLCSAKPDDVTRRVIEDGTRFRELANGYAIGSGNSIPEYVPVENYLAMIEGARQVRESGA